MNPFNWRQDARPSIFCGDPAFTANARGKTRNEASAEGASENVKRVIAKTGRSPGSMNGISRKERIANREKAWARKSGVL